MRAKLSILLACAAAFAAAGCEGESGGGSTGERVILTDEDCPIGTRAVEGRCVPIPTPLQHDGNEDYWFCQSTDEACERYCAEGEKCGLWESGPVCLAACRDQEIFFAHSNIAHACITEEGCAFLENTAACIKRKQDASSYECADDFITVCDEEGCCFYRSCDDACASHGLRSEGCGHSEERGHDACRCAGD